MILSQSYAAIANHCTKRPAVVHTPSSPSPALRPFLFSRPSRLYLLIPSLNPFFPACPFFWHRAMLDSLPLSVESPLNILANPADSSLLNSFDPESIQSELALWESLNFSFTDMDTSKDGSGNNSNNNSNNGNNNLSNRPDAASTSRSVNNTSQSSNSGSVCTRDKFNVLNLPEFRIHLKLAHADFVFRIHYHPASHPSSRTHRWRCLQCIVRGR